MTKLNPLLDPIIPALRSYALVAAVRLGVFDAIHGGHTTPTAIAEACGADLFGVQRLVDALAACGYLVVADSEYRLSHITAESLVDGTAVALADWVRFSHFQLQAAAGIESAVRSGETVDLFDLMNTHADRLVHQRAMAQTALPAATWVAEIVSVPPGATRMLDIGGSHGVYSAALCRANPPMKSIVFELPLAVATARAVAVELETDTYCTHIGEDFAFAELDGGFDVAFLGNVIHHYDHAALQQLLSKACGALKPGGVVAIWDLAEVSEPDDATTALFSLFFHVTSRARCHSEQAVRAMTEEAGFTRFETFRPPVGGTHSLYVACRPDAG